MLVAVEALIDGAEQQDATELLRACDHDRIVAAIADWDTATNARIRRRLRIVGCQQIPEMVGDLVDVGLLAQRT
jgi:hypothetical protein